MKKIIVLWVAERGPLDAVYQGDHGIECATWASACKDFDPPTTLLPFVGRVRIALAPEGLVLLSDRFDHVAMELLLSLENRRRTLPGSLSRDRQEVRGHMRRQPSCLIQLGAIGPLHANDLSLQRVTTR